MLAPISVSPVFKSRTVPLTVCRTCENTKVGITRRTKDHRNRCSRLVLIVSICKDRKDFVNKFLYFYPCKDSAITVFHPHKPPFYQGNNPAHGPIPTHNNSRSHPA